jgi:transposase-like protein
MFRLNLARDMLMEIIAKCPECCKTWRLDGGVADRRIRCKHCGRLFKVPKPDEVPKAAEVIERAKGTIYVDEDGKTYG